MGCISNAFGVLDCVVFARSSSSVVDWRDDVSTGAMDDEAWRDVKD